MPTIQIEANLSFEQLLNAARQMSRRDLHHFIEQVLLLRAQYDAPTLPDAESELLLKINQPVPADVLRRYDELITGRDERTLTPEEHQELLRLTDQVETLEAERLGRLIELAKLRQVSLDEMMRQLGLQPLPYV
ncbi:MAG: STAS/SEC14 domain-containing protein [Pyrinomonadaceae bacterium]|nr:STAS/SEC14 domain-containing protein [Pyrinomonadaceae bacterium]